MTIRFQCECGKVLMASDDQAGLEGQCPACGKLTPIPETEMVDMEEPEESLSAEQFDEKETGEEASGGIKGLEDLERGVERGAEDRPEKRGWFLSSRFGMLMSILVVVIVALVVFMVVRRERQAREEVVIIKKIQPMAETEEETPALSVGARLEEEEAAEPSEAQEAQPLFSSITEGESTEEVSTEQPVGVETEVVPGEGEQEVVASTGVETPPAGAFTINVASFKDKQRADRFVEELDKKGIDAYDWEIDLPEKGRWYRVSVGGFSTRQEAENYKNDLRQKGISDTFITQIPGASS